MHVVSVGETSHSIAHAYGVDPWRLVTSNPQIPWTAVRGELTFRDLVPGDELRVPSSVASSLGSAETDKAQSDPYAVIYDGIAKLSRGEAPSRQDLEAMVVAAAVIAGADPELLGAMVALVALTEAVVWLEQTLLGGGGTWCDNPPIDANDVRWWHFGDVDAWPPGSITEGAWSSAPPGSFEAFALPILGQNWEQTYNCRAFIDYRTLIDVLVDAWNKTHEAKGDERPVNTRALQLPYATYRAPNGTSDLQRPMFVAAPRIVPGDPVSLKLKPWEKAVENLAKQGTSIVFTEDHDVTIHRGAPTLSIHPGGVGILRGGAAPMSTGKKIAIGVGVAAAAAGVAWLALGRPLTMEALKYALRRVGRED